MSEGGHSIVVGIETSCVPDLNFYLESIRAQNFEFMVVPLVHPRYERSLLPESAVSNRIDPFTRSDTLLTSSEWSSLVCGKLSPWLDVDAPNDDIRINSLKVFFVWFHLM